MTNPFDSIDDAFSPMFMDMLSATCIRDNQQYTSAVSCCIFPLQDETPFDDIASHSDIKKMNIVILVKDWLNNQVLSSINPEVGDRVITDDGLIWNVSESERLFERWNLTVRSKV